MGSKQQKDCLFTGYFHDWMLTSWSGSLELIDVMKHLREKCLHSVLSQWFEKGGN